MQYAIREGNCVCMYAPSTHECARVHGCAKYDTEDRALLEILIRVQANVDDLKAEIQRLERAIDRMGGSNFL